MNPVTRSLLLVAAGLLASPALAARAGLSSLRADLAAEEDRAALRELRAVGSIATAVSEETGELPEDPVDELPEDPVDELPEDPVDELPEDPVDELPEDPVDELDMAAIKKPKPSAPAVANPFDPSPSDIMNVLGVLSGDFSDPDKGAKDTLMDVVAAAGDPVDPEFFDDLVFDDCIGGAADFQAGCDCLRIAARRSSDGITAGICTFIGPIGNALQVGLNTDIPLTIITIIGELLSIISPGMGMGMPPP